MSKLVLYFCQQVYSLSTNMKGVVNKKISFQTLAQLYRMHLFY